MGSERGSSTFAGSLVAEFVRIRTVCCGRIGTLTSSATGASAHRKGDCLSQIPAPATTRVSRQVALSLPSIKRSLDDRTAVGLGRTRKQKRAQHVLFREKCAACASYRFFNE